MNLVAFNRQLIFNKSLDIRISFRLRRGKKYGEQKLCKVDIWTEETLTFSKARGVITGFILLLKCQKQTLTACWWGRWPYVVVPTAFRILWIYQVLPFFVSLGTSSTGNKIPDREFYWAVDHEFYYELRIWNC